MGRFTSQRRGKHGLDPFLAGFLRVLEQWAVLRVRDINDIPRQNPARQGIGHGINRALIQVCLAQSMDRDWLQNLPFSIQ